MLLFLCVIFNNFLVKIHFAWDVGFDKKNRFLLQQQKDDMGNKAPTPYTQTHETKRKKKMRLLARTEIRMRLLLSLGVCPELEKQLDHLDFVRRDRVMQKPFPVQSHVYVCPSPRQRLLRERNLLKDN